MNGGLRIHLHKAPQLSNEWGEGHKSGSLRHLHYYFVETYPDKVRRGYVVFGGTRSRRIDDIVTAITPGELLDRCLPGRLS
jgi:hypothetical protein